MITSNEEIQRGTRDKREASTASRFPQGIQQRPARKLPESYSLSIKEIQRDASSALQARQSLVARRAPQEAS